MANMLNKMKGFLGLDDEYDDDMENETELENKKMKEEEEEEDLEPLVTSSRRAKVVNINNITTKSSNLTKISIIKPVEFDEATNICDNLKDRQIVVVNTTLLDTKTAQRLLDFISGTSYALSGELQEVEKGVYILTPSNVEVSNELKSELSTKGIFNWK